MQCRRTANAGVLLTLDGVTVLLDGVCRQSPPYLGTPLREREMLLACPPDITAFTHGHLDHFDRAFAQSLYEKTLRSVLGPEGLLKQGLCTHGQTVAGVTVTPIPSRHIGRAGKDTPHVSFWIRGSEQILFTGDAAPSQWKDIHADVLIAPYAYAITEAGWKAAKSIASKIVIVHMPDKERDDQGLWQALEMTVGDASVWIPDISREITL